MIKHILNNFHRKEACRVYEFAAAQYMDTDCIEVDVDIFQDEFGSNIFDALNGNEMYMAEVQSYLRNQNLLSKGLSLGYPLFYWKWYQTATEKEVKGNQLYSYMDFGKHSVQDLCVKQHFANIKEEALATGLISAAQFEKLVVNKAADIMKTAQCRKIKSKPFGGLYGGDPYHFDIPKDSKVSAEHIQAIILYCDFTQFCALFGESLRALEAGEGLEIIKKRNSKFFNISKALRELTTYFGSNGRKGYDAMNGQVKGPFFSGVSVVLNLSEFSIGFNTPTSTTKTKEIAWRFAGEEGMVITVGNQKSGHSKYQPLFNATWISNFVEEDEYLWFGSVFKLSVESISVVASSRNYRRSMTALYLFAAALTGQDMSGMKVKKEDVEILAFCLKHVRNEELPPKPQCVDEYVLDSLYCFTQSVTKLHVDMVEVNRFSVAFQELIFYGLSWTRVIPKDESNLIRRCLIRKHNQNCKPRK